MSTPLSQMRPHNTVGDAVLPRQSRHGQSLSGAPRSPSYRQREAVGDLLDEGSALRCPRSQSPAWSSSGKYRHWVRRCRYRPCVLDERQLTTCSSSRVAGHAVLPRCSRRPRTTASLQRRREEVACSGHLGLGWGARVSSYRCRGGIQQLPVLFNRAAIATTPRGRSVAGAACAVDGGRGLQLCMARGSTPPRI